MSETGTTAVVKKPRLPFGWTVHVSKSYPDRVYYFNETTGCTTWEIPTLEESPPSSPAGPVSPDNTLFGNELSSEPEDYEEEPDEQLSRPPTRASSDEEYLLQDEEADLIVQNCNIKDVSKVFMSEAENSTDTSSFRNKTEPALPIKSAIKNYLDLPPVLSVEPTRKKKPMVHFADSTSPKFSPEDVSRLSDDSNSPKGLDGASQCSKQISKAEKLQPTSKSTVLETFFTIPARENKFIPKNGVDPKHLLRNSSRSSTNRESKVTQISVPATKFIPRSVRKASLQKSTNLRDTANQRGMHLNDTGELQPLQPLFPNPPHHYPNFPGTRMPIPQQPFLSGSPHTTSKTLNSNQVIASPQLPSNFPRLGLRQEYIPTQFLPVARSLTSETFKNQMTRNSVYSDVPQSSNSREPADLRRKLPDPQEHPESSPRIFKSTFVVNEAASASASTRQTSFTSPMLQQGPVSPSLPVCTETSQSNCTPVKSNIVINKPESASTPHPSFNCPSINLRQKPVTPSFHVSTEIPPSNSGFEKPMLNFSVASSRKRQISQQTCFSSLSSESADSDQLIGTPAPFSSSSLPIGKNSETCLQMPPLGSLTCEGVMNSDFILWDSDISDKNTISSGSTKKSDEPQENSYTFSSVPAIKKTSVSLKEEDVPAPKKKRLSIDRPFEREEWPRVFEDSLDSAGLDGSSCSSVGTASLMWESLLRPSKLGITSAQQARSFGDHWGTQQPLEEAMDWESADSVEPCKPAVKDEGSDLYAGFSLTAWHIVLDTNVLLQDLKFVTELRDTLFEGCGYPVVVIPWVVLQELDLLKAPRHKNEATQVRVGKARAAVSFILENLSSDHPRMKGQSYDEFQQHKFTSCTNNDDKILHFCSSLQKKGFRVTLLTEDKNLRNKSLSSRLEACSKSDLLKKKRKLPTILSPQAPPDNYGEPLSPQKAESLKADEIYCRTKAILYKVLKQVLVLGMKKFSKTMWQRLVVRKPPWSLDDILYCLRQHWMAVFHDELPPNAKGHVESLETLLHKKSKFGHSLPGMKELVETSLSLCSCVAKSKSRAELVRDPIKELKSLLQACQGKDLGPALDCDNDALAATCKDEEAPEVDERQLQEVQNFFTALWERVNTFCTKLEAMMSGNGAVITEEVEKNISAVLRTVKQFVQLNKKLLKMKVSAECREVLELHSVLLSESSDSVVDPFSEHALSLFYKQNKDMLAQAQVQFEKFVTTINSGVRYLMSNRK